MSRRESTGRKPAPAAAPPSESDRSFGKALSLFDGDLGTRFLPEQPMGPPGLAEAGYPEGFLGHLMAHFRRKVFTPPGDSPTVTGQPSNPEKGP